jgi:hypothetical protein
MTSYVKIQNISIKTQAPGLFLADQPGVALETTRRR